ncbi:MAG: LysR family transcriptional regulator [Chromatiales bacterium]|nr:LysR family transcriptional regulator [Chromatiales bacterium]
MTDPKPPYYKQNRLKQLRAFVHAAQAGTVSKAAERLFLSQPSVSLQIQALEREFSTTLFERRGPSIKLTPEGEVLYELARPLIEAIDQLQETFYAHCGRLESGQLSIAAGEATILYLLPEPIKQFVAEYPGIDVKLQNVTGRDGMVMLRADEVDFAVGSFIDVPDDVCYRSLKTYKPVLITPRGHPLSKLESLTLADISPYGLILPPRHLSTWRIVDTVFNQNDATYQVALEAGGWEVVKKYVENGLGVSIVIDLCLTGDEDLEVIPLSRYFPKRDYGIVTRRGRFLSPQARRFIDMMDPHFFEATGETHNIKDDATDDARGTCTTQNDRSVGIR